MWVPLVVLAILATIGGLVGIGTAFTGGKHVGGRMNIVNWMDPIIWNPATRGFGQPAEGQEQKPATSANENPFASQPRAGEQNQVEGASAGHTGFNLAHAIEGKLGSETATEWVFILISLIVAGIGMGLGFLFYIKDTRLPDIWAARLGPLYRASYNKYWIDEFYGWAFTRPTMDLARVVFGFDSKVVDGAVNGSAWLTRLSSWITGGTDKYFVDGLVNAIAGFVIRLMSPIVRAAQTGFTSNYALVMVIGLLVAVAVFFGKDLMLMVKSVLGLAW
jgi:NADH:ubiquinone oxidoreductase subunit 5 (subunit L)/multisubunit Na+/H+ antiporter MnhA subunit